LDIRAFLLQFSTSFSEQVDTMNTQTAQPSNFGALKEGQYVGFSTHVVSLATTEALSTN